jgi:hypothetical protein
MIHCIAAVGRRNSLVVNAVFARNLGDLVGRAGKSADAPVESRHVVVHDFRRVAAGLMIADYRMVAGQLPLKLWISRSWSGWGHRVQKTARVPGYHGVGEPRRVKSWPVCGFVPGLYRVSVPGKSLLLSILYHVY